MADEAGLPVVNMLLYVGVAMIPTAVCGAVLWVPKLIKRVRRGSGVRPQGPPIEKIVADLRRVRRALALYGQQGTPQVRRIGTLQAYDELLMQACRAVDVAHRLDTLRDGTELELERLRVEEQLRQAGLVIT
jgi:hypothetical protein